MADYTHTIDRWGEATGQNLIERIAGVSDYQVAVETYRAAVNRWPGAKITLQPGAGDRAKLGGLIYLAVRECVLLGHSVELSLDHERRGVQRRFLSRARGREHVVNQPLNGVEGRMHDHCYLPLPGRQSGSHHRNDYARIFEQVQVASHPILGVC